MAREKFTPVFEEAESVIIQRMIDRVDDTWRKEPGDFMYDAIAPAAAEIKLLEMQLDETLKNAFAIYAEGPYLDKKLGEVGLTREPAAPNKRRLQIVAAAGVIIDAGYTISAVITDGSGNPIEYTTDEKVTFTVNGSLTVDITAKVPGTEANLATGTQFILMPPIAGVSTITDLGATTIGTDVETDEAAYERYEEKTKNPDTGGNKHDYVRWAKEVTGVGDAKCIPRWDGNGTVKVVIVGEDMQPTIALVPTVQEYLDPNSEGLGNGKAPMGAAVTVVSAAAKTINIAATVTYKAGYSISGVLPLFTAAVQAYFKELSFEDNVSVVYNKIGALLMATPGVENYTGLTVNGTTGDVSVDAAEVAVIGTISI